MGRGKRYNQEEMGELNIKKVIAVIIAFLVIIMFIVTLVKIIKGGFGNDEKITALRYYSSFANGKWGVIDSSGETVINNSYDEMVIVPNPERNVFIVMSNVDYSSGTYTSKAINEKSQELFSGYEQVEVMQNYDKTNSIWYETSSLRVKKSGKYGLIDYTGNILLNADYDEIVPIIGVKNSYITSKDGKKGLVSSTGSVVINNQYSEIKALTDKYEDGYIVKNSDGKVGVIATSRKEVVPVSYDDIKPVSGDNKYFIVKKGDAWYIYNSEEGSEVAFSYDDAVSIDSGKIIVKSGSTYGLINTNGEVILSPKYDSMKYAFSNNYIAHYNGKYGVVDETDNTKILFKYDRLNYIKEASLFVGDVDTVNSEIINEEFETKLTGIVSETNIDKGYIKLRQGAEYKYYNFKLEEKSNKDLLIGNTIFLAKQNDKYGFVNKDGVVVVNYTYDDATEQNASGYAAVKLNGKWGAVDKDGKVVVEPTLNLDNNALIDFIGEWHLGADINTMYYTK